MKKRIFLIFLSGILLLSVTGCADFAGEGKIKSASANVPDPWRESGFNDGKLLIGAFCGIDKDYIDQQHIKEASEAGIDMLFVDTHIRAAEELEEIDKWCTKYAIKWLYADSDLYGVSGKYYDIENKADKYADLPSFAGNIIRDEPGADEFDILKSVIGIYNKAMPTKKAFINLFPNYADPSAQLRVPDYQTYVNEYVEKIPTEYISLDFYPCTRLSNGKKGTMAGYCEALDIVSTAARNSDRDFYGFIQATTWSEQMRMPDETDIRWQMYTYLAFGARALFYFTYSTPDGGGTESFEYAMIDRNGQKTPVYYAVQKVNSELDAFSKVYMEYKSLGAYAHRASSDYDTFENQYKGFSKTIKKIECSEPLLIGCYENKSDSAKKAFTVVNMSKLSLNKSTSVTLTLPKTKKVTSYKGGKAEELSSADGQYVIELDCGEGVFVTVE